MERVIYSSLGYYDEDTKESVDIVKGYCEANEIDIDALDLSDRIEIFNEDNEEWYECEILNLGKKTGGNILAIVDIGTWNGRKNGYKKLSNNLSDVLMGHGSIDGMKLYFDGFNVRSNQYHHDGVNFILYRELREDTNYEILLNKIYNGEEISSSCLNRYTRSLRRYMNEVYGFSNKISA